MSFKDFISQLLRHGVQKFHHFRQNKFSFDITLGILACLGIIGGFILIYDGRRPPRTAQPITQPAASYYKHFIAGSGIVESMSENIEVGTLVSGIIDKVYVEVGAKIKAGSPLFSLDKRQALADVATQKAAVEKASASLGQAEAALKDAQDKYQLAKNVSDRRALSRDEFLSRENAYKIAQNAYAAAKADLGLIKATLARSQTDLDILTVRAPIDCEVLQINVHPSEFALAGPLLTPLMLIGNVDDKFVRMSVDENDAWRFSPGAPAIAYLRGNSAFRIELEFDHLEPYVLPKRQLTGDSSERVDIRVLQPIYKFKDNPPISVYIGQQVDVFIEVPEALSYENMGRKQGASS